MVKVATRPADNPVGAMARRLHIGNGHMPPRLSLPGKLVFPSSHTTGHFSMLGLGDIVMPGLLLCFVMRYDAYKKAQVIYWQIITTVKAAYCDHFGPDQKWSWNWTIFAMKFLKSDNNNRYLISLSGFFYWHYNKSDLGLGQSDHINRMITLIVITISGFYCT